MQLSLQEINVIESPAFRFDTIILRKRQVYAKGAFIKMVKPIIRDVRILMKKSVRANKNDLQTARDLLDTLGAHADHCAGMAANMIGVNKNIIAVQCGIAPIVMLNPKIISHSAESYSTEEGCLSLDGVKRVRRYYSVEVEYDDLSFERHTKTLTGVAAQAVQHEIDHLFGKLI